MSLVSVSYINLLTGKRASDGLVPTTLGRPTGVNYYVPISCTFTTPHRALSCIMPPSAGASSRADSMVHAAPFACTVTDCVFTSVPHTCCRHLHPVEPGSRRPGLNGSYHLLFPAHHLLGGPGRRRNRCDDRRWSDRGDKWHRLRPGAPGSGRALRPHWQRVCGAELAVRRPHELVCGAGSRYRQGRPRIHGEQQAVGSCVLPPHSSSASAISSRPECR